MSQHDIDKAYVSPYDKFLFGFDAQHEKTLSQMKEILKHQRIAFLRDNPVEKNEDGEIWSAF